MLHFTLGNKTTPRIELFLVDKSVKNNFNLELKTFYL